MMLIAQENLKYVQQVPFEESASSKGLRKLEDLNPYL
jgi:hypothetical protein